MCILRHALEEVRHEVLPAASADPWATHFSPEQEHDAGAGRAIYRRCLRCCGMSMVGSLSAHARWCDRDQAAIARHAEDDPDA